MNITREMVARIADLAQLELTEPEKTRLTAELETIVGYMDALKRLPVENAEPPGCVVPVKNVLREDEARPSLDRAGLLKNAPAHDGACFLVPKTVE